MGLWWWSSLLLLTSKMQLEPSQCEKGTSQHSVGVFWVLMVGLPQLAKLTGWVTVEKYKTFFVLIYSYINMSGNWKNEKLCGNTTPAGWSVFTQFWVFPIFTSVDITVYQYGKNVLYYNRWYQTHMYRLTQHAILITRRSTCTCGKVDN